MQQTMRILMVLSGLLGLTACGGAAAEATANNDEASGNVAVAADLDADGVADTDDADRDGDGVDNDAETAAGSNPDNVDTDADGVEDAADNCRVSANVDQVDTDADGVGDTCSPDDDHDGLSDAEELNTYGTNPQRADSDGDSLSDPTEIFTTHTNPNRADTDNDQSDDAVDRFPTDAAESADADGDGVGDHGDNCPAIANVEQANSDARYAALNPSIAVTVDAVGDACDPDRDGDGAHITFVDATLGDDAALGTFAEPVRTLARALALAEQYADEIWLAPGIYAIDPLLRLPTGRTVTVRGGRTAAASTPAHPYTVPGDQATQLVLSESSAALVWNVPETVVALDHVLIRRTGDASGLQLQAGMLACTACALIVTGEDTPTAVTVENGTLDLRQSVVAVEARAPGTRRAVGIHAAGGQLTLRNSVVWIDRALQSTGLVLAGKSALVQHSDILLTNTDDKNIPQRAYGIALHTPATVANSVIMTEDAIDQAGVLCASASLTGSTVVNNGIVSAGGQGPQPVAVDCDGSYLYGWDADDAGTIAGPMLRLSQSVDVQSIKGPLVNLQNGVLFSGQSGQWARTADPAYAETVDLYDTARNGLDTIGAVE